MANPAFDTEVAALQDSWVLDRATGGDDVALRLRLHGLWRDEPEKGPSLIMSLAKESKTDCDRAEIAEMVDWLLKWHGDRYWHAVNQLCAESPAFRAVVALVWGSSLSKDLRRKIEMWRS